MGIITILILQLRNGDIEGSSAQTAETKPGPLDEVSVIWYDFMSCKETFKVNQSMIIHVFFCWVALTRREIYNVKGGIPGLVSKNTVVLHSWQDFREKHCNKKRTSQSVCGLGLLELKGGWSNGERIPVKLKLDYGTPSHAHLLKWGDIDSNE